MSPRPAGVAHVRAAVVVVGLLLATMGLAMPVVAADVVSVTVNPGDPQEDASLRVGPTVQVVDDQEVRWQVVNGSALATEVTLAIRRLATGDDGAVVDGAALPLTLERTTVRLGPGDGATVAVSRRAIADEIAGGFALVVEGSDTTLRGIVVSTRGAPDAVDVTLTRDDGRLLGSLALSSERALVTDLQARLVSWPGRVVADTTIRDVVVLPGGRTVALDLAGTAFVGPVDLEVVAGTGRATATSSARAWIVNRTAVRGAGTTVLVVTVLAMVVGVVRLRRRRLAPSGPADDD